MRNIITIDGPSGVGKGTVAQRLARKYGLSYLDSGVLYRLVALRVKKFGLQDAPINELMKVIVDINVRFVTNEAGVAVFLNEVLVDEELRLETTGQLASQLAAKKEIRAALLDYQRNFAVNNSLVADGRDMGTVVFPEARLKIFLDASVEVRAQRRYKQLIEKGENVILCDLEEEIAVRDLRDRSRAIAPLVPASDAVVIDSTDLSVNEVFEKVKYLYQTHFF